MDLLGNIPNPNAPIPNLIGMRAGDVMAGVVPEPAGIDVYADEDKIIKDHMLKSLKTPANEDYRLEMYFDSRGVPTIAGGTNLKEDYAKNYIRDVLNIDIDDYIKKGKKLKLTEEQGRGLYDYTVDTMYDEARKVSGGFEDFYNHPLGVRKGIVDFVFNVGAGERHRKFTGYNKALAAKDYERAALELKYGNPDLEPGTQKDQRDHPDNINQYYEQRPDRAERVMDYLRGNIE